MLLGDINENGKFDDQDIEWMEYLSMYDGSFSPYVENDEWWKICYHSILGDSNIDGSVDSADSEWIKEYKIGRESITSFIRKYNIYDENDTAVTWWELELQNYNY